MSNVIDLASRRAEIIEELEEHIYTAISSLQNGYTGKDEENLIELTKILKDSTDPEVYDYQDYNGNTPLMVACKKGSESILHILLKKEINIHKQDKMKNTALFYAVEGGNLEIVKILIDKGSDINHLNFHGQNILIVASYYGHLDIFKYLYENYKFDINKEDGFKNNSLSWAIVNDKNFEFAKYIKSKNPIITEEVITRLSKDGNLTAFQLIEDLVSPEQIQSIFLSCCFFNHVILAQYLLKNKKTIDVNLKERGNVPLLAAASKNNLEMVELLIDHGANVNIQEHYEPYWTPLMYVVHKRPYIPVLINKFIQANVDTSATDINNKTALYYCTNTGNLNLLQSQ